MLNKFAMHNFLTGSPSTPRPLFLRIVVLLSLMIAFGIFVHGTYNATEAGKISKLIIQEETVTTKPLRLEQLPDYARTSSNSTTPVQTKVLSFSVTNTNRINNLEQEHTLGANVLPSSLDAKLTEQLVQSLLKNNKKPQANVVPAVSVDQAQLVQPPFYKWLQELRVQKIAAVASKQENTQTKVESLTTSLPPQTNFSSATKTSNQLFAGTIIELILEQGINTDLPGYLAARTMRDMYDSQHYQRVLLPKGTKLLLSYDNQIKFGQESVAIEVSKMILQDGSEINFTRQLIFDVNGKSGLIGAVDNHYSDLLISSAAAGIALDTLLRHREISNSQVAAAASGAATAGSTIIERIIERKLDQPPTITFGPGKRALLVLGDSLLFMPQG